MTSGITFNSCELGCYDNAFSAIQAVNGTSISSQNQNNFFSNIGAKKLNPISAYVKLVLVTTGPSQYNSSSFLRFTDLVNDTIPMSGDNYTIIPSLSAQTCDVSGYRNLGEYLGVTRYNKTAWHYITTVTILNVYDVYTVVNGVGILIYTIDLNTNTVTYINQNYFIGPNITLSSTTISNGSLIPIEFKNTTYCGESNNSPAMSWTINSYTSGTTQTITSYEILCEDIDATGSSPNGYFVHWYVTGITSGQTSISVNGSWAGSPTIISTDYGSGDRANGWNGPCPPSGTHNYRIQVTARLSDNTTLTSNYLTFTST